MNTCDPDSFRGTLQTELLRRIEKNPKYSLRSFARSLDIGSSDLSRIINCKRNLTEALVVRLGTKMGLDPVDLERYCFEVKKRRQKKNKPVERSIMNLQHLLIDNFRVISDWYHLAILELTRTKGFRSDSRWVAKRLGITVSEVNIAVQRLVRLDLLKIEEDGSWMGLDAQTTSIDDTYTEAAKIKMQKQLLEKAITALQEISIEDRDQSSMYISVNKSDLGKAKNLIKEFRRHLCTTLESSNNRNDIYVLGISFFPLTTPIGGRT